MRVMKTATEAPRPIVLKRTLGKVTRPRKHIVKVRPETKMVWPALRMVRKTASSDGRPDTISSLYKPMLDRITLMKNAEQDAAKPKKPAKKAKAKGKAKAVPDGYQYEDAPKTVQVCCLDKTIFTIALAAPIGAAGRPNWGGAYY